MRKTYPSNSYAPRRDSNFHRQPHGSYTPSSGFYHRKAGLSSSYRLDFPPDRNSPFRQPNFVVKLFLGRRALRRDDVESLIAACNTKPENFSFYPSDDVAAFLNFLQWTEARDAVVWFWKSRLAGLHDFTPELISNVLVPSDRVELDGILGSLFAGHVKGLMEGKEVKRLVEEKDRLFKEIDRVSYLLRKPWPMEVRQRHADNKKGLVDKKSLIERRVEEFVSAMTCILKYLEGNGNVESGDEDSVPVFRFGGMLNWKKIHSFIVRECSRLEGGLPIYAYRREILREIHHQQTTVSNPETGSWLGR